MELLHHHSLSATVRALDGDRAVLVLADGQIVRWPLNLLPKNTKPGDVIGLHAGSGPLQTPDVQELAHAVLNKIFAEGETEAL